jgi:hypothetical protein
MNTNDSTNSNNPMNTGTGSGANYGTGSAGTGLGTGSTPSGSGTSTTSSGNLGNSSVGDSSVASGSSYSGGSGSSSSTGYTTGMFRDRSSAEQAYSSLSSRGYTKDDVNLLMSDETRKKHFGNDSEHSRHTDLGDKAMEGAGVGSAIGGTAGAVIGAIAAIGTSVALPGLGLVVAGPLAAALAGAGAGGLTGGLVGALVGSGIPEEHAVEYENDVKNGGIVMGVRPRNEEDARYFEEEFRRNNGDKVRRY